MTLPDKTRRRMSPRIWWKPALGLLTVVLTASLLGGAKPASASQTLAAKCDRFLAEQASSARRQDKPVGGWTEVIARYGDTLTPGQEKQMQGLGADVYRHLPAIHSVALRLPTRRLHALAALPFVQHLSADLPVRKTDAFTVSSSVADRAYQQYSAAGFTLNGSGVSVAVIDSGIRATTDFNDSATGRTRIKAKVNLATDSVAANADPCGHGSHVAGIVAGNGAAGSGQYMGIAPQAGIVDVRVLNRMGQGTVSGVIAGVQWAISNRAAYNIRVLNLSSGHPVGESYKTDPLCQIVEQAWKAGIVVVVAAGNEGRVNATPMPGMPNEGYGANYGSIQSPGNDPYVITVGAMKNYDGIRNNDQIATYSSRGPSRLDLVLKPDLVAPGNKVVSALSANAYLPTQYPGNRVFTTGPNPAAAYYTLSGTSMATPVVAGAAALMLQAYPALTPDIVKARLMFSADKWGDPNGNADPCTYGAGYLNILAALRCTAMPAQAALSPNMSTDSGGSVYINMDYAIWGKNATTGTYAIWGTGGVTDLRAIWGTYAIWGTSANVLNASHAIWGTNVWNDHAIWGTTTSAADLTTKAIYGE